MLRHACDRHEVGNMKCLTGFADGAGATGFSVACALGTGAVHLLKCPMMKKKSSMMHSPDVPPRRFPPGYYSHNLPAMSIAGNEYTEIHH